jgi:hypothetical protein
MERTTTFIYFEIQSSLLYFAAQALPVAMPAQERASFGRNCQGRFTPPVAGRQPRPKATTALVAGFFVRKL